MKALLIDNFDSFTYNLVDELKGQGCDVMVYRNDITMSQLKAILESFNPKLIVLSPGPSHPKNAGICIDLIKKYHKQYPMVGICLGHQCMIEAMGGKVTKTKIPVHGKKSLIFHEKTSLFNNVPNPFYAGRYHSLYGSEITDFFKVTATAGDIPMAIENSEFRIFGFQFHPESILTAQGSIIIENVLEAIR